MSLPNDPAPEDSDSHAALEVPIQSSHNAKHRWLTLNRISLDTLIAGEVIDSWGTHRNITHTMWVCGYSSAFNGGYDTNVAGAISSLGDLQAVCGVGPAGQSANWDFDATRMGSFSEGGWVTQWHLSGARNKDSN